MMATVTPVNLNTCHLTPHRNDTCTQGPTCRVRPAMAGHGWNNDWMDHWMAMTTLKMQPWTFKETQQAMAGTLGTGLATPWAP